MWVPIPLVTKGLKNKYGEISYHQQHTVPNSKLIDAVTFSQLWMNLEQKQKKWGNFSQQVLYIVSTWTNDKGRKNRHMISNSYFDCTFSFAEFSPVGGGGETGRFPYHDFVPPINFPDDNRENNNLLLKISPLANLLGKALVSEWENYISLFNQLMIITPMTLSIDCHLLFFSEITEFSEE